MTLRSILFDVSSVVVVLTVLGLLGIVGISRIRSFVPHAPDQLRDVLPYLVLVGGMLLVNSYLREVGPILSWIIGWRITGTIIAIEGNFVGTLQGYAHPLLTRYFSYIYIYGYVFLLVFPVVIYFIHWDSRPLKEVALSYVLNYGIGVIFYIMFVALGPRNAGYAEPLLYSHWPQSKLLTSEVNANVNVFPSLHTSVALTVALLAYRWRDIYWSWFPISTVLGISVAISTMYLGIHWATDVVVGLLLAVFSVRAAVWLASPARLEGPLGQFGCQLRRLVDWPVEYVIQRAQTWYRERQSNLSR